MEILLLGGPKFLGRHIIDSALARGHNLTVFNRGRTNPDLYPQIHKLLGDRDGSLDALRGGTWDAVIDTSGYVPRIVGEGVEILKGNVGHYTFVSSISVYAGFQDPGMVETAPVSVLEDETVEEITGETYGALKALCEGVVESGFPGRAAHIRAGLIVGPYDPSDRFTYWPARLARGGEALAPGSPESRVQFVDARDLAGWMVRIAENNVAGVFNATGPEKPITMGAFLQACQENAEATVGNAASLTWLPAAFLLEQGAAPWSELPMWIPETDPDAVGFSAVDCSRAIAAGLTFRPLSETLRDTLTWVAARPDDWNWRAGLAPEREAELLQVWHGRTVD